MDNIGLCGAVHMDTCGKDIVIKWVVCPIVTAMEATLKLKMSLPSQCERALLARNTISVLHVTPANVTWTPNPYQTSQTVVYKKETWKNPSHP